MNLDEKIEDIEKRLTEMDTKLDSLSIWKAQKKYDEKIEELEASIDSKIAQIGCNHQDFVLEISPDVANIKSRLDGLSVNYRYCKQTNNEILDTIKEMFQSFFSLYRSYNKEIPFEEWEIFEKHLDGAKTKCRHSGVRKISDTIDECLYCGRKIGHLPKAELADETKKHLLCGLHKGCELGETFDTPCSSMMPCFFILDDKTKREYYIKPADKPAEQSEGIRKAFLESLDLDDICPKCISKTVDILNKYFEEKDKPAESTPKEIQFFMETEKINKVKKQLIASFLRDIHYLWGSWKDEKNLIFMELKQKWQQRREGLE